MNTSRQVDPSAAASSPIGYPRLRQASRWLATLVVSGAIVPALAQPATERMLLGNTRASFLAASADAQVRQSLGVLQNKLAQQSTVRVIVGTRVPFATEGRLTPKVATQQRQEIALSQTALLAKVASIAHKPDTIKRFKSIPFIGLEVTQAELQQLAALSEVTSIEEDKLSKPALLESVPLIGAPAAWSSTYTGAGRTVAVLDTGVDKYHPFLASKVVSEACYSTNMRSGVNSAPSGWTSLCPGGVPSSIATDSALPYGTGRACPAGECDHGTHVAGIIAGRNGPLDPSNPSVSVNGVARDANLIAIQVFSRESAENCTSDCVGTFDADQILGLERVLELSNSIPIDAVNMSLGGGSYSSQASCDADNAARKVAIDNLRSVNIATVISSGNSGFAASMGAPACISSAISVGSTWDSSEPSGYSSANCAKKDYGGVDKVSCFSNSVSFLNLLAPGAMINSSVPGTGYASWPGTSMAAPHVAGAWALLKQKKPTATVSEVLAALTASGVNVTDDRNGITKPRIYLPGALVELTTPSTPNTLMKVSKSGDGVGTVTSFPEGINCGPTCSASFNSATPVTLTATANLGVFTGWSGVCTGSGPCSVVMESVKNVHANFVLQATTTTALSQPGLSGNAASQNRYLVDVPAGAKNLQIQTSGGTGDVDMYVRSHMEPTTEVYECASGNVGNTESCAFAEPQTATYHIMLAADAATAYSGVSLTATHQMPVASPGVWLAPDVLTFPDQAVGTTGVTQIVSLTNTGTAVLSISSISSTTSDFSLSHDCGTALYAECTLSVSFSPTAIGSRTAFININDNAWGSPHQVSLSGNGIAATSASTPLNDTGIDFCGDASTNTASCATVAVDVGTYPRQDARYGRDAAAAAGVLPKVGGGGKGFDFTKIANNGSVLPASAVLGSGASDWACTRDNVTGLVWEVKTTSDLRSMNHTYTWYSSDATNNGGNVGTAAGGVCFTSGRCDTEKFVADVNAAGLCGKNDWRMPRVKELEGIADMSRYSPTIDISYFPNTLGSYFWSGSPYAGNSYNAWGVYFNYGNASYNSRHYSLPVRLVRGGQ